MDEDERLPTASGLTHGHFFMINKRLRPLDQYIIYVPIVKGRSNYFRGGNWPGIGMTSS